MIFLISVYKRFLSRFYSVVIPNDVCTLLISKSEYLNLWDVGDIYKIKPHKEILFWNMVLNRIKTGELFLVIAYG